MTTKAKSKTETRTPTIDDLAAILQDLNHHGCEAALEHYGWRYEFQEGGAILATEVTA